MNIYYQEQITKYLIRTNYYLLLLDKLSIIHNYYF